MAWLMISYFDENHCASLLLLCISGWISLIIKESKIQICKISPRLGPTWIRLAHNNNNNNMASDDDSSSDDFSGSDRGEQMDWNIEFSDDAYRSVYDLCENDDGFSEDELVEQLKKILELFPSALHLTDENGWTLLHHAIHNSCSVGFCKVLIDHKPDLVKTCKNDNYLPIHVACDRGEDCDELIKFLISQYPESANIPDANDYYPVHCYIVSDGYDLDVLALLLKCDEKALSTPNNEGNLPLHSAVKKHDWGDIALEVFNAYPQAIYIGDEDGDTPLDIARFECRTILDFLDRQFEHANEARQNTAPDENGRLPIHRALLSRTASLGAIKLMVAANPTSVNVADNKGRIPLHIASRTVGLRIVHEGRGPLYPESKTVDLRFVKFLVETNKASLNISDSKGNFALHHACAEGNCAVVNFILTKSTQGVSMHNMDGKLPIELFLYEVGSDFFDEGDFQGRRDIRYGQDYRETKEYVETVYHLLRVHLDALKDL